MVFPIASLRFALKATRQRQPSVS